MSETFKNISEQGGSHTFLLDKNHPENALKETIKQIKERSSKAGDMRIKIVCLYPECENYISK